MSKKKKRYQVPERRPRRVIPTEDEAAEDRDEGLDRVDGDGVTDEWREYCDEFAHHYLLHHHELLSDNLWDAGLEPPPNGSLRALGPRFILWQKAKWIVSSGQYFNSRSSHLSSRPVWLSQIYVGEECHCETG